MLSSDEALSVLLIDDADEQAGAPLDQGREIVVALSEQDVRTVELSLRDVVAGMDRREFADNMPLDVDGSLRWADDLEALRRRAFGEPAVAPLSVQAVRARRIDWAAWSEAGKDDRARRAGEVWFGVSDDDLAVLCSAVRHATARDPAVMEPVDERLMTDEDVGRALTAALEQIARRSHERA